MSSLFCSNDFWIDCSVHFNLEACLRLDMVWKGAIPGAPCWTYAAAAVTLCVLAHAPWLPTRTALQVPAVGNVWPVLLVHGAWSTHHFQVAWPSSETDINGKDQSGLAFEEVWRTLLCKPAESCGVPFMFAFCLCPEGRGRIFTWWGLLMLVANSFQINYYFFFFNHRPLTATGVPWSWHCSSKAARERGEWFLCTPKHKNKGTVLIHQGIVLKAVLSSCLCIILGPGSGVKITGGY